MEDNSECRRRKAGRLWPAREKEGSELLSSERRWENSLAGPRSGGAVAGAASPRFLPSPGFSGNKKIRMPLAHTSSSLQRPSQRQLGAFPLVPFVPHLFPTGKKSEIHETLSHVERNVAGFATHRSGAVLSPCCPGRGLSNVCAQSLLRLWSSGCVPWKGEPVLLIPLKSFKVWESRALPCPALGGLWGTFCNYILLTRTRVSSLWAADLERPRWDT